MVKAAQIAKTEYPELNFIVEDVLPYGLSSLAGRPKVGKSWLALQIAYAVSVGGDVLGKSATRGRVLYLSLEDSERRIQSRMAKQRWDFSLDPYVDFETTWPKFTDKRSIGALFEKIEKDGITLTVIDTISRVLPHGNNDEKILSDVYGQLQSFCLKNNKSILLCDHHRKRNGDAPRDGIDDIWGATQKGAILDAYLAIYRVRQKASAKLCVGGRDIEELEYQITFDRDMAIWENKQAQLLTDAELETLSLICANEGITNAQICEKTGKDKGNVSKTISSLIDEKMVFYKKNESDKRIIEYYPTQNGTSLILLQELN